MFSRKALLIPLLLAVGGGPILGSKMGWFSKTNPLDSVKTLWSDNAQRPLDFTKLDLSESNLDDSDPGAVTDPTSVFGPTPDALQPTRGGAEQVVDLNLVLRMDVDPDWVDQQWGQTSLTSGGEKDDRDSTASQRLRGMRVPCVAGAKDGNLFGSLTYYFDKHRRVQRIQFHGWATDPRPLIALMIRRYRLRPAPAFCRGLYLSRWNGAPTSVLHIQHTTLTEGSVNMGQQVAFELNRPSAYYRLSHEFYALLLREGAAKKRWP